MAIGTFRPEAVFVNIVLAMATVTVARRVTMFVFGLMAVGTLCIDMFAAQLKVGEKMVECCLIKTKDVRIAPFMVRMTGGAIIAAGIGKLAVKAGFATNVITDVFMTVNAKLSLLRPAKRLVAR